jgi:hypothetical protein
MFRLPASLAVESSEPRSGLITDIETLVGLDEFCAIEEQAVKERKWGEWQSRLIVS